MPCHVSSPLFFFFNDTATTEIYTLSLHDALPICIVHARGLVDGLVPRRPGVEQYRSEEHTSELQSRFGISYAVFCLKKKNYTHTSTHIGSPAVQDFPPYHSLRR